jgi:hypothetical protein
MKVSYPLAAFFIEHGYLPPPEAIAKNFEICERTVYWFAAPSLKLAFLLQVSHYSMLFNRGTRLWEHHFWKRLRPSRSTRPSLGHEFKEPCQSAALF